MTRLEEPAYDAAIWNSTHACAYPANKVNICVNKDFYADNTDVVEFLGKYTTTTQMINRFWPICRISSANTQQAAEYFLKNFESTWTQWVSADVAAKLKAR